MLLHPTLNQLDQLGLAGMTKAFMDPADNPEVKTLDHAEWLGLLLDREATERQDRRLKSRLRNAKLRYSQACVEDIILNRLVHNAHKITLKGEAMRKHNAENLDDSTND